MRIYKIPVSWEVYGIVEIEADSLDDAIRDFDNRIDEISLPLNNDYIDGSFHREDEETCSLNNTLN